MLDAAVWNSKHHFMLVKTCRLIVNLILSWQIITKVIRKDLTGIINICIKSCANQTAKGRDMPLDKRRFWWFCWWRWMKSQSITKVSMIYPLGTKNVCTKSHGSPSSSCWDTVQLQQTHTGSPAAMLTWRKTNRLERWMRSLNHCFVYIAR